jgi:hypothetical protein
VNKRQYVYNSRSQWLRGLKDELFSPAQTLILNHTAGATSVENLKKNMGDNYVMIFLYKTSLTRLKKSELNFQWRAKYLKWINKSSIRRCQVAG